MARALLDKASYSLVRTNPKLTGNVKVVSDGTDIYLESFSANTRLSSQKFKAFKVDGTSTYDRDVFKFFDFGKFPKEAAYEIFQEYEDDAVLSKYGNQYEMFYCAGTRSVASESYSQSLAMLAPLWLNEQMPGYFVIFRMDNPAAVNNFRAATENENTQSAQTATDFSKNVLENCTAIKTFDLSEGTELGSYIRNYRNQETFPKAPLNISWRKDEPILWSGISYNSGGFTSSGSYSYEDLVTKDSTIIQDEYLFTQGFQNNGILLANLLNMEFLFDDPTANDYSINRYFGMYVNDIQEGQFDLSGEGFYKNTEKTQLPKITTITEVSQYLNTPFQITNEQGILLFLDPNKTETVTGLPTPKRVDEVNSIFYVKDKEDNFHTVKKGSQWEENQIRLFDTQVDISLFTGYKDPDTFANASIISRAGVAQMYVKILDNLEDGFSIQFKDGATVVGTIFADSTLAPIPGKSFQRFFNPNGTLQEVTQSITSAINKGINENDRFFVASYNDTTIYVKSRFSGDRFNRLSFSMDYTQFPEALNQLQTYPITSLADFDKQFVGGNDVKNSLLKVELGDQDRFTPGDFIQTTGGYTIIGDWVPYTDEPIYNGLNEIIGYTDIDKYAIITCNDNQIMVTRSNQVALYSDYKPSFGRFSFFEVRDFDFDFYSTLYSQEGELDFEFKQYNQTVPGLVPVAYTGISNNTEVRNFYDNGGFYNLIGLLNDAEDSNPDDEYIKSEYVRLEENFLTSQASISRIAPYINKWGWVNDGKDVRNHPYRLDVNEAFGLNNFAPSKWDKVQEASGFTHEWYYLTKFPEYIKNDKEAIKKSWSYNVYDVKPNTEPTDPTISQAGFIPGTFQNTVADEFNKFFIVDSFDFSAGGGLIEQVDRQLRYGRLEGGDEKNFSEAFLRGVRIIAKEKAIGTEKPNFNARSLSYVPNGSFNDYRFSAILVPNLYDVKAIDTPDFEIKFIKNEKWKTVVMLISVNYSITCDQINTGSVSEQIIDRTSLYSINSNWKLDPNIPCAPIGYNNTVVRGAVSLTSSYIDTNGDLVIRFQPDKNGNIPNLVEDVRILADGTFGDIAFKIGLDDFIINGILSVVNTTTLRVGAGNFKKNGTPVNIPSSSPNDTQLRAANYIISDGGYNQYLERLNNISFGEMFDSVNQGNPTVVYETIKEDGSQVRNKDGSLAQTFGIELRAQADILKSIYIGVLPDPAKPTAFNLTEAVGYDLSLQKKPRLVPFARHAGYYSPYALNLLNFKRPYGSLTSQTIYEKAVSELCKWKNAEFSINSNKQTFGQIQNFFYHKVNEEDPSTVLELSRESAFPSLYPLINEIGIDYKDFYMFSSNWEPSYFTKSIDKSQTKKVIGTRSMFERKSFFGSKYLKVPETIVLETFKPSPFVKGAVRQPSLVDGTFMYLDQPSVTINKKTIQTAGVVNTRALRKKPSAPVESFYLFNQKRLMEYLFTPIKEQFLKYVNELYGWGDLETLDDDVNQYIRENILKLYKVDKVELYTLASRTKGGSTYTTAELTDAQKVNNGLTINNNVASKTLNTNPFDLRLIYNKRTGFSESFGFSVTIVKK
jgi:hypothetical protein